MQSQATTVAAYLKELPPERSKVVRAVRKVLLSYLPKGYEECMQYGMICYGVPLKTYPKGYLDKKDVPLPFAAIAAQKNFFAIYLMSVYGDGGVAFREAYKKTGKKLDMGKSCIRFKKVEDVALEVIGEAIARVPVKKFIERYEEARKKK